MQPSSKRSCRGMPPECKDPNPSYPVRSDPATNVGSIEGRMRSTLKARRRNRYLTTEVAEGAGFEPARSCPQHAFQACALNHSAIPPGRGVDIDTGRGLGND